jgi:hypothetical protein
VIGEQRASRAFLSCEPFMQGPLMVELRDCDPTVDPRSGEPIPVPPLVVLWVEDRPCAVRLRSLVAISRFPADSRISMLIENEALLAGLPVERVWEAELWRLFSQPPRPWIVR